MLNIFRKVTTLDRINKQIEMTEESLITNMHNAEHFAAMAQANRKQLITLRAMKAGETGTVVTHHVNAPKMTAKEVAAIMKDGMKSAPRLATSK